MGSGREESRVAGEVEQPERWDGREGGVAGEADWRAVQQPVVK